MNPSILARRAARAVALALAAVAPLTGAADVKMLGRVSAITVAPDGKSATVMVTNVKGGAEVSLKVSDAATLEKLSAKSIAVGDQVRLSDDDAVASNPVKMLKKAEGC